MPNFTYVARDLAGQKISGTLAAASERDVVNALSRKSLFPIEVAVESTSAGVSFGGRVSDQKIAVFYGQLASLLKSGVPLLKSLSVLRAQSGSTTLQNALDDIVARVEDGQSLGDAFARHPRIFNEVAINMARAGAEGGFLEDALERVAAFTEHQAELKARTLGALIYPGVLATVCILVVSAILIFVVPIFEAMFERLRDKGQLPAATEFLLGMSAWITANWWWLLGVLAILLVVVRVQVNTDIGRMWLDRWRLNMPLFGVIFRNLAVSRFCRVLGTLLKNGVPILKSLDISRAAAGNRVLSEAIGQATENITAGESLSVPLNKSGHFPRNVIEMIAVAEESNTMDTVLVNIADGLERETTRRLELVVKMIEPGMLIVMAGVVLFLVMALLMPIVKMSSAIQ